MPLSPQESQDLLYGIHQLALSEVCPRSREQLKSQDPGMIGRLARFGYRVLVLVEPGLLPLFGADGPPPDDVTD